MPADRRSSLTSSAIGAGLAAMGTTGMTHAQTATQPLAGPEAFQTKLLHCFPNVIPGIHRSGDTPDIAALIAPRALHLNFGETDGGSPIQEVRAGVEKIAAAYASANAADRFTYFIEADNGHVRSDAM